MTEAGAGGRKRIYLVDGPSQMFRAFFAIRRLSTRDGLPTNAVYGFLSILRKILRTEKPDYLVVLFDTPEPTFRHEAFAEYKANRPEIPKELEAQIPYIFEACEALRVPVLAVPGFEADDLIATLARKAKAAGLQAVIVANDKDLFQLVDDDVLVMHTKSESLLDAKGVEALFGVPPSRVADVLSLMGDSVDNIPGVPGIGEKGAKDLVRRYGALEEILRRAAEVEPERYRAKLLGHEEEARRSRRLVELDTESPVELELDRFRVEEPDRERARALFQKLEFTTLLQEIAPGAGEVRADYRTVWTEDELREIVRWIRKAGRVAVDTETTSREPMRARIVGISLAVRSGAGWYIPLGHRTVEDATQIPLSRALEILRPVLEDPGVAKVGQNAKYDRIVLEELGVELRGLDFDTMVAAYLLNPTRNSNSLDSLAGEYLKYRTIPYEEVAGKGAKQVTLDEVPVATVTRYAAEDADVTLRLYEALSPKLAEQGLERLYRDVELPLVPILAEMERTGIKVDADLLREMSKRLEARIGELTAVIHRTAGEEFNINSPKQLGEILFVRMKLPTLRKTRKTGAFSTSEDVLVKLAAMKHELPVLVLEYRELQKLRGTYVDALPALIHPDTGRVHTSFNQTVTATGRLSSDSPNLQNIPIRTEMGREIRKAFVPEPGSLYLAADYSQVELRILAHMSGDPILVESFRRGEDIHRRTAAEVFGMASPMVTDEMRRAAKAINFGILYGMGPQALAEQIGATYGEAKAFIARYFDRYAEVRRYIDRTLEALRRDGQVTTLFDRVRRFPEIAQASGGERSFAERAAINTTIQGTAADLMKMAMIRADRLLRERKLKTRMILQVHDELVFEGPEKEIRVLEPLVREAMEEVHPLAVPLVVDVKTGTSWYDV